MTASTLFFEQAQAQMPGGVSSPARAFKAVGGIPPYIIAGQGCTLKDVEGRSYIDYLCGWGALLLGHARKEVVEALGEALPSGTLFGTTTPLEVYLSAELIQRQAGLSQVRFVNSGTEATMSAVRLARAATGRSLIVKYAGGYHGHADTFLVKAGSSAMTLSLPDSPGVPPGVVGDVRVLEFNDRPGLEALMASEGDQIAAVIIEPVPGNMGVIVHEPGYLTLLRSLCDHHGALLIFDEVITGFRLEPRMKATLFECQPDLFCYGKVLGGGLPLAAFGGKSSLMALLAPSGPVFQAGTYSGNPLSLTAGLTTLRLLKEEVYTRLEVASARLEQGLTEALRLADVPGRVQRVGSMMTLFFTAEKVRSLKDACGADHARYKRFFHGMLLRGVYLPPSGYEAFFVSAAHTDEAIDQTIGAALETLRATR